MSRSDPAALAFGDAAEYDAHAIPTRRERRFIMFHQHKTVGRFYLLWRSNSYHIINLNACVSTDYDGELVLMKFINVFVVVV